MCSTGASSDREAAAFDFGGGPDVKERAKVLYIAQVVIGLTEIVGVREPSVVVGPMTCGRTGTDVWLLGGSAYSRISSKGSGACVDEEGESGLVRIGTDAGMLWSSETAGVEIAETWLSWVWAVA